MYRNQRRSNHRNNRKINAEVWISIFVSAAALWINYNNLQYNRLQAYESARIADQLRTLNQSDLIIQIENKLREEKNNAE